MHVLILGAAGMIGRKFVEEIDRSGELSNQIVTKLTLADVVSVEGPNASAIERRSVVVDLSDPATAATIITGKPDVIIHLAAIVSGEAEKDFEKGYRVNLDGTRHLLEAIRLLNLSDGYCPRFVYASSLAVFGAPFPDKIDDQFFLTPLTSYGTQKAMGELLLDDYSRRGFVDGVGLRLPTICIRPGKPNKAASGFFSGILREPLSGHPAILPVGDDVRHWHASPRSAVRFLTHAVALDSTLLGHRRNLTMPGVSATVGDQIEALRKIAGDYAVALIQRKPDPAIQRIVAGWPKDFDVQRASQLGFKAETSFEEIIRVYIDDELSGHLLAAS
jgi:nucleoside-diphosphate-sugar epimerase